MAKTKETKKPEEKKEVAVMWNLFDVTVQFTARLCGAVPLKKEMIEPWLRARMPEEKPVEGKSIEELKAEVETTIAEVEERITLGFQRDDNGLFVRADTFRSHMKDCANQLRILLDISGFKSKVANRLYVEPGNGVPVKKVLEGIDYKPLYLVRDGKIVDNEDEEFERPVHAQTPQGMINALKRIKFVRRPMIRMIFKVLNDNVIKLTHLKSILDYGSVHGFYGERSMQEGQYTYEIEERKA